MQRIIRAQNKLKRQKERKPEKMAGHAQASARASIIFS